MLIGGTGRGHEEHVAARSTARQTARFWENFGWALAYALGVCGENRYRFGRGPGFDRRQIRLDRRCWGHRFGKSRSL
jgi:hypothetical protein